MSVWIRSPLSRVITTTKTNFFCVIGDSLILGVVGSRTGFSKTRVFKELDRYKGSVTKIVSGGARGVDSFAEEYARNNDVVVLVLRPRDPSRKIDYLFRNVEILSSVDELLIFWNGVSRGTKFVYDYARFRNKRFRLIRP